MFGTGDVRHKFLFGRGMTSDDAEHACMTAQALLEARHDSEAFSKALAWRLRWWLVGLPLGTGKATLLSTLRLWAGVSPSRSGVFSAGNGPAMRAPILGACLHGDSVRLRDFVRASTRLTHTDPKAEQGALAVALAAAGVMTSGESFDAPRCVAGIIAEIQDEELRELLRQVQRSLEEQESAAAFASRLHLVNGVSGYMYHTVPVALYCFLRHPGDFRAAVESVIRLGGDTDSTAAIVGALAGARGGIQAIPDEWRFKVIGWPRTDGWLCELAERLQCFFDGEAPGASSGPLPLFWPGLIFRNLICNMTILAHVLRRALPP
jgi:ADP-ribosylglycohydrolase